MSELKLQSDLLRIESDLICKQKNGKYMKFNRALNAVALMNMTKNSYLNYWKNLYSDNEEEKQAIIDACEDKFDTGLISSEEMIELVKNSKDNTSDKPNALKLLGVKDVQ